MCTLVQFNLRDLGLILKDNTKFNLQLTTDYAILSY
jgi:hypothetical protein